MLKKYLIKSLIAVIISFMTCIASFASVAILKSEATSQSFAGNQAGSYDNYFNKFVTTFVEVGADYRIFDENNIQAISNEYNVLVIPYCTRLTDRSYNKIKEFISGGGQLLLISPPVMKDGLYPNQLASLLGVNIAQIDNTKSVKYANWIEENQRVNNSFPENSTIAKLTLQNATSVAVWDEVEKNEPAVAVNKNGAYIAWLWGIDGDKSFNIKSMQYSLKKISPQITIKESCIYSYEDFNKEIQKIRTKRENCKKLLDLTSLKVNPAKEITIFEYLSLAEFSEIQAQDAFDSKNYGYAYKLIDKAKSEISTAYKLSSDSDSVEARAVWFDRGTIASVVDKNHMSRIFDLLKESGINIVYFETLNAGYTIYPSRIAEQNPVVKGKDPLQWALDEAKKRNIELHAWMWIFAAGNDRHNPIVNMPQEFNGPILAKNASWQLIGEKGNLRPSNQHEYWIDPSNTVAKNYIISIAEEIATNYDVDGFHIDYIRYPFQSDTNLMGFNKFSIDQYEKDTGTKLDKLDSKSVYLWNIWKQKNINDFVRDFSCRTRKINPDIKLSAAVFGKSTSDRKNTIQQNWELWVQNGWIDTLNPMIYAQSKESLVASLQPFDKKVTKYAFVYPGIALKHLDNPEIAEQFGAIKNFGLLGNTMFAIAYLDNPKSEFLKNGPYRNLSAITPGDNKLYSAQALLKDYINYLEIYKKNSTEICTDTTNPLHKLISDAKDLLNHMESNDLDYASIKILVSQLKASNAQWSASEISNSPEKIKKLKSYFDRIESLLAMVKV